MADRLQTETGVDDLLLENGSDGLTTEAAVSAETPVPGGAIAGGRAAVAAVALAQGGALAGGNAPSVPLYETPGRGAAIAGGRAPFPLTEGEALPVAEFLPFFIHEAGRVQ